MLQPRWIASAGVEMIEGIAWLLGFQLIGEVLSYAGGRHVPGPVIGLALLALALVLLKRRRLGQRMEARSGQVADGLLANLGVLFVPAGVGIIQHLDLVRAFGLPILAAILLTTVATLVVTVWVFLLVKRAEQRWRRK